MVAARRRAIDRLRREGSVAGRAERLAELVRLEEQEHPPVSEESAIVDARRSPRRRGAGERVHRHSVYASQRVFVAGFTQALWMAVVFSALGVVAALRSARRPSARDEATALPADVAVERAAA